MYSMETKTVIIIVMVMIEESTYIGLTERGIISIRSKLEGINFAN